MQDKAASSKDGKLIGVVQKIFPPPNVQSSQIIRLMIAVNAIISMTRMFLDINKREEGGASVVTNPGDRLINFLLSVGILNEAMDAFRAIQGWFKQFIKTPEEQQAYQEFCQSCDKNNPQSLYCRVVSPLRNEAAFHWDQNMFQTILGQFTSQQPEEIFVSYDGTLSGTRFSLADDILAKIVTQKSQTSQDLSEILKEITKAYEQFELIANKSISQMLKERGAIREVC